MKLKCSSPDRFWDNCEWRDRPPVVLLTQSSDQVYDADVERELPQNNMKPAQTFQIGLIITDNTSILSEQDLLAFQLVVFVLLLILTGSAF